MPLHDADVMFGAHGSIVYLTPLSAAGRAWIGANCATRPWQWQGGSLCVEHRYAADILDGIVNDGLTVARE